VSLFGNGVAPVARRVRAYFAPVNRATGTPTIFDPAQNGAFPLDTPQTPWIDLGWCANFRRSNTTGGVTGVSALRTGTPALATAQVRTEAEASIELEFACWGKLQMALAGGSQQMNLLQTAADAPANGSGGAAIGASPLLAGSTATVLQVGTAASEFSPGDLIVVDVDYTGQIGFVGTGVSGAYVRASVDVHGDVNYIRRVSLNVARIEQVQDGALRLSSPLLAGAPQDGMKICRLLGFVDREGGSFFQEWSGLFVLPGEQGDRVIYHYPRLQTMKGAAESKEVLTAPLERIHLAAGFRALPIPDANDSERVLCFRSYLPA
jgi:hypothetical protein